MSDQDPPDSAAPDTPAPAVSPAPASPSSTPSVPSSIPSVPVSPPAATKPPRDEQRRRRRLEGVIPDIVRRAVELGVEKTLEAPDNVKQLVGDLKLPKEIAHYLLTQIDETKNGLFRVVAKEIRDFLEHTNFAGEMQKILTTVQFEVNTTIRFTPNDGRSRKSKPKSRPERGADEAGTAPSGDEDDLDADDDADDDDVRSDPHALPKPEVKTAVHVHREDRRGDHDRRKRRDRG